MRLELTSTMSDDYPDDFNSWPQEEKHLWFAEQERYRKNKKREEEAKENAEKANGSGHKRNSPPPEDEAIELSEISVAAFALEPAPPRVWHVPDMIPASHVTMLGGDGKVGKSKLAMQLCVATVAGLDWLGMTPVAGSVLYIGAKTTCLQFTAALKKLGRATASASTSWPITSF